MLRFDQVSQLNRPEVKAAIGDLKRTVHPIHGVLVDAQLNAVRTLSDFLTIPDVIATLCASLTRTFETCPPEVASAIARTLASDQVPPSLKIDAGTAVLEAIRKKIILG